MSAVLRRAFTGAALAWAGLLVAVPFLASRSHATSLATAVVVAVYAIGSLVCHQLPDRSWRLWTAQMPVCARCTGIYFGAAIAVAFQGARGLSTVAREKYERATADAARRLRRDGGQPSVTGRVARRPPKRLALGIATARITLAVATLPSAATLVYEWTTGVAPSNVLRFAAGIPIGVVVAWLVVSAAEDQVN